MKIIFKSAVANKLAYPSGVPIEVADAKAKKYIEDGIAIKATEKEVKAADGKETATSKKAAKKETANKK